MEGVSLKNQNSISTVQLPLVALRGLVLFPNTVTSIDIARDRSLDSVRRAMEGDGCLFAVAQRDSMIDHPSETDLFSMGTIVHIKHIVPQPDQSLRVLVEGEQRALLSSVLEGEESQTAVASPIEEPKLIADVNQKAVMRTVVTLVKGILNTRGTPMPELVQAISGEKDPGCFADVVAAGVLNVLSDRQAILECSDVSERLNLLLVKASEEAALSSLEEKVQARAREYMERANHDYFLREQIHAIQDELGEGEDEDIVELRKRLCESKMPEEAHERVEKELRRLARTAIQAPESSVSQNYIEYMLDLPWGIEDESPIDLKKARRILDEDHYGMKEVKERLIEYLAVRSITDQAKSPILCLVGPPGVGKTSIARSVARALGRKFTRISLGGVHDEAEIRGHRKTYVGAMPGKIISAINQVKTVNPVFLLDEIDKMAHDMRGDPASAMLEVLDPEQNCTFRDHYLEAPFDLSKVLFITTANSIETIDRALLDRMEVIEVPSYTIEEKVQIAKRHLMAKELEANGLKRAQLRIPERVLFEIIDLYTRESGVRTLERVLGKICRKVAVQFVDDPDRAPVHLKKADLPEYLGTPQYLRQPTEDSATVGVVNGLAWTSVGGEVMPIEVVAFPGKGAIEITGNLGDVMKESARLARSVVRARLGAYRLKDDYFEKHDIHIHVPEGAVPKDGPSAGVALTCAILSAIADLPARNDMAMTGEVTLTGRVLPIGGVKEKLLAAYRMGITHLLLPKANEKDLEKIDSEVLEKLDITLMDRVDDALDAVLEKRHEESVRLAI